MKVGLIVSLFLLRTGCRLYLRFRSGDFAIKQRCMMAIKAGIGILDWVVRCQVLLENTNQHLYKVYLQMKASHVLKYLLGWLKTKKKKLNSRWHGSLKQLKLNFLHNP